MTLENTPQAPTIESVENRSSFENLNNKELEAVSKLGSITEVSNVSVEQAARLEDLKRRLQEKIRRLTGTASFALLMCAAPSIALAEEGDNTEKLLDVPAASQSITSDTLTNSAPQIDLEQKSSNELYNKIITLPNGAIGVMTETVLPLAQAVVQKKIQGALEAPLAIINLPEKIPEVTGKIASLADETKPLGERVDTAIEITKLIPGLSKKIPQLAVIEQLRQVQKDLTEGKNIKDVAFGVLQGVLAAKTFGLGPVLIDYLKNTATLTSNITQPSENERQSTY